VIGTALRVLGLFGACALTAFAAEPIRIGEIEPLTGKEAAFGQSSHRGILLAVEELNRRGGILGPARRARDGRQPVESG
jgi:branched-chain amino acid transport system substrate-binding protein